MCDVKGRQDLLTRGWTKLGAQARSNTSVFMTIAVFFSGKYGFNVLPLSLQSASYSCPRRTSQFLEAVVTTRTTTTLAYNTTNHEISTTPVYLVIYGCCSQQFLCHRSYTCTCLNHELELCGRIPCMPTRNQVVSTSRLPLTSRT